MSNSHFSPELVRPRGILGTSKRGGTRGEEPESKRQARQTSEDEMRGYDQQVGESAFQGAGDFDDLIQEEENENQESQATEEEPETEECEVAAIVEG